MIYAERSHAHTALTYLAAQPLFLQPNTGKLVLTGGRDKTCRFCEKMVPDVTFKNDAHAIPEAFGNKWLLSDYECDACNHLFGTGIEDDLGKWSKPNRTMTRIRGKNGVPTIKRTDSPFGWRIESRTSERLNIHHSEDDAPYTVDEAAKKIHFTLTRDTYTPVAVLKAFVKIGLTLMPHEEIPNFRHAFAWIRDKDHTKSFVNRCPIFHTFRPGPVPNDLLVAWLLRRKPGVTDAPYAIFILSFGNDTYQVALPSEQDEVINGRDLVLPPFPAPRGVDQDEYGDPITRILDLTSRAPLRGDQVLVTMSYESSRPRTPEDP